MFKKVDAKVSFPQLEEEILKFWDEEKIFEKSVKKESPAGDFVFYEGPPTANGKPGLHHVLARSFKDVIPRYKTMKGYRVERKAGWDTHGLPVELQVEKALGLKNKQDIENIVPGDARSSIIEFNKKCKESVWEYRDLWEKMTKRMGYWVDMEHPYVTYENGYIESVWWQLAQIAELKNAKGESFLYKGYRVVPYCYRCGTALSSHEVAQGYQTVKDNSVYVKFQLTANNEQLTGNVGKTYLLAWTTTPWTLPGNVALAVNKSIKYQVVNIKGEHEHYVVAKDRVADAFSGREYETIKEINGSDLVGLAYKQLFDVHAQGDTKAKNIFLISGKSSSASREYYPHLKKTFENQGYDVTIIDHKNSGRPQLRENVDALKEFDFADAHVVTHSLGASTILKFLDESGTRLSSLTMIAPTYPGRAFNTRDPEWMETSGYKGFSVDFQKIRSQINGSIDVVYSSDEDVLNVGDFIELGKNLGAKMHSERGKKHFFGLNYQNNPDFVISFGNMWKVFSGDFVTTDSGTGIVHIAPAFGEDDANVGKENGLPTLLTVEADGTLIKGFGLPGEGIPVKKKNDKNRYAVDDLIIEDLKQRNLFFKEETYEHEYPFCWRCDTPLIYYAKPSWFIRMSEVRDALVKNNEGITWVPEHIKEGRFGEWLSGAKDWAISRERYWGTPLPIWECEHCDGRKVFSSIEELRKLSGETLEDVHKPYIDDVTFACECGGTMKRTPEVLDVWFDSGAMPLAQYQYLGKGSAEKYFPADYICEAIDQTRGWFYTLHAIATLLHQAGKVPTGNAYKNVICLGHVLDAQGKKMSKSKGNIIDPFQMFEEYGADPLRWMLYSINQPGLPKRFDVKGMRDVQNRVFRMLWNSYSFFTTYASIDNFVPKADATPSKNLLDRWILSELNVRMSEITRRLDNYDIYGCTQDIQLFIDDLSNWYIRRSRKRFWKSEDDSDKENAYQTLYDVLVTLAKAMAPFTPFLSEEIYRNLTNKESVHLADWPVADGIDERLMKNMSLLRELVTIGLQQRSDKGIKVRQPLQSITLGEEYEDLYVSEMLVYGNDYTQILLEELNVKEVKLASESGNEKVILDFIPTPELKLEGEAREIIRAIQEGRKKAGFNVEDRITLGYQGKEKVFEMFGEMIAKEILATSVQQGDLADAEHTETVEFDGAPFVFSLKRV